MSQGEPGLPPSSDAACWSGHARSHLRAVEYACGCRVHAWNLDWPWDCPAHGAPWRSAYHLGWSRHRVYRP